MQAESRLTVVSLPSVWASTLTVGSLYLLWGTHTHCGVSTLTVGSDWIIGMSLGQLLS
jgi:hypothetical protein